MKKCKDLFFGFVLVVLLTNCAPSSDQIANAVNATVEAKAAEEVKFTAIPTEDSTSTPAPTASIAPTPSPTADTRIAITEPRKLVLSKADLPKEGDYIIPNELWSSPRTNEEIIQSRGQDAGSEYLSKSGRVTGWEAAYVRRNRAIGSQYPIEIVCSVIQFKTSSGAKFALDQTATEANSGYQAFTLPNGDPAYTKEISYTASSDMYLAGYELEEIDVSVQYKNYAVEMIIIGIQGSDEVSRDIAVDYAMKVIEKIEKADLYPIWVE